MPSVCVTNISKLMQKTHKRRENVIICAALILARLCTTQNYSPPRIFFQLQFHPADIPSGKLRISSAFQTGIPQSVPMNVHPLPSQINSVLPIALLRA